jgi:hypothetical protein
MINARSIGLSINAEPDLHDSPVDNNSLTEQLLASPVSDDDLRDIIDKDITENFKKALFDAAPLPQKLAWKQQVPATLFALGTTVAGSVLYYLGSLNLGPKYVWSSLVINAPQSALCAFGTADFLKNSFTNFKKVWGRFGTAAILGATTSLPSTFATFNLSQKNNDPEWWQYTQAALTFVGGLSVNIYGMDDALKRPIAAYEDNPKLREFLAARFRESLPSQYQSMVDNHRSTTAKVASYVLGSALGTAMTASLAGYVFLASDFLADHVGKNAGLALGILANAPTAFIALLMNGYDLAKGGVNFTADIINHLTGKKKMVLTEADKKYCAALTAIVTGFSYAAYYSSGTSQTLYDDHSPLDVNGTLSQVLRQDVVSGTIAFNEIFLGNAAYLTLNFIKTLRATKEEDREIYAIRNVANLIYNGSIETLEEIARANYGDREAEWKKPEAAQATTAPKSFFSSVTGFFSRKEQTAQLSPSPKSSGWGRFWSASPQTAAMPEQPPSLAPGLNMV